MAGAIVAALSVGAVFHARYRVVRCIHAARFADVYEVVDEKTEGHRALKLISPSLAEGAELRERFERQAKVTGAIESDHIVRTLDAGVDGATGAPFFVMELLRGEEMGARLKRRSKLRPAEVVLYLSQAARALEKAHAVGVIHRDLRPENLFVTLRDDGSPCVKVRDFGAAKAAPEGDPSEGAPKVAGARLYWAPEQLRGDATIGPVADVHALGHIAYTLLVGEPYWAEEAEAAAPGDFAATIMHGLREPASARALRRRGVKLPPEFDAWIAAATAPRAVDRFTSALDAIIKLGAVFGVAVSRAPPPEGLTADDQGPPREQVAPAVTTSEAIRELVRALSRRAFITLQPGLFLVIAPEDARGQTAFYARAVSAAEKEKLEAMKLEATKAPPEYEIMPLIKAPGYPSPDRIAVGRARKCDIVLRDPSASKIHAHFKLQENGKFCLVDLESQNGTFINGVQLTPNKPEFVWPGDTVTFGSVDAWLLDASALYDLLT